MSGIKRTFQVLAVVLVSWALLDVVALAQGTSNNFRIDESFIGPGSNLESSSSNFSTEAGQEAVGNAGAVRSASDTFSSEGGSETTADPTLTCELDATSVDFGTFSTAVTETATANFRVKNYTSYGYNVALIGSPPAMGNYELTPMTSTGASQTGTEQFGINLVANTDPEVFGSFPVQDPDSTFSYGDATANYSTPDQYRFVEGETIASAPKSSGLTHYTISYVINVSNNTPGGVYTASHVVLCTGTY